MRKPIHFIALMLSLPLFMTHTMAMDAPMEPENYSLKRTLEKMGHEIYSYLQSYISPSPSPALPLETWHSIYQSDRENTHNLLLVCKGFHDYFWSLRTNVGLCPHGGDHTLEFMAPVCPNLTTLTIDNFCHHTPLNPHRPSFDMGYRNELGHSLALFTNLKTLRLWKKGAVTGEVISKLTNLNRLELPLVRYEEGPASAQRYDQICLEYYQSLKTGIISLTQLDKLDLGDLPFPDDDISQLQFLKHLVLNANEIITDSSMEKMTNLTTLELDDNEKITLRGLSPLTNLTRLKLYPCNRISAASLTGLTHLQHLSIDHRQLTWNFGAISEMVHVELLKKAIPHLDIEIHDD